MNELAAGRASILIGGLGHSTSRVTGLVRHQRVTAVRDCIEILKGIAPERPFYYKGERYTLSDYRPEWAVAPAPLIYAGATGPNMLRMAAAVADGTMMGDVPLARMAEVRGYIAEGLAAAGRDTADFSISNFFAWHIGTDRAAGLAEARRNLIWRGFLQDWHIETFLDPAECRMVQANRQAFLDAFLGNTDTIAGVPQHVVSALVDNLTFAGGPEDVASAVSKLRAYAAAGLDEVALKIHGEPEAALKIIGDRLLPALAC